MAASPPADLDNLKEKYDDQLWKAHSRAKGDAAAELAMREVSEEFRARAWKLVSKRSNRADLDETWRFALGVDLDARAEDLLDHAEKYLTDRPDGEARGYASYIVALLLIERAKDDAVVDRTLAGFDSEWAGLLLDRGGLRAIAGEVAIRRGDIVRARALYGAAVALPKSEEELEAEERNRGEAWRAAWQERIDSLVLFEKDWSGFGSEDTKGKPWRVSDYRGKVLIIDYWASW